jgi:hypothetical protein
LEFRNLLGFHGSLLMAGHFFLRHDVKKSLETRKHLLSLGQKVNISTDLANCSAIGVLFSVHGNLPIHFIWSAAEKVSLLSGWILCVYKRV